MAPICPQVIISTKEIAPNSPKETTTHSNFKKNQKQENNIPKGIYLNTKSSNSEMVQNSNILFFFL